MWKNGTLTSPWNVMVSVIIGRRDGFLKLGTLQKMGKYSEVKIRIPASIQLHSYSEQNFATAALKMLFCKSNTCKMWKIKFRMNFKNVTGITSAADVDLGYSALSEGFVFNVKHVPSHSVTCALIPWQIRSAQSRWNIGTHAIYKQTVKVHVCQDWASFYLLHGLWGWEERELIKRSTQFSLPPSLYLFIFRTWKLSELLIIPRVHFLFFFPSRKAADLSRWGAGRWAVGDKRHFQRSSQR